MQGLFLFFFGLFHNAADNVHALLDAQGAGVQADVVVLSLAPGPAGVVLVVDPAAFVLFKQAGFRALVGLAVAVDDAIRPEGGVGADKGVEGIVPVFQM